MRAFLGILLSLSIVLSAGCLGGGLPADTNEKKLYAAEIIWRNTLRTIDLNVDRLTLSQKAVAASALKKGQAAMVAARTASGVNFSSQLGIVNSSIDILLTILETMEVSYGRFEHHSFA